MGTDNLFTPAFVTEVYINEYPIKMEVVTGSLITVIGLHEVKIMNLCLRSTNAIFKSFNGHHFIPLGVSSVNGSNPGINFEGELFIFLVGQILIDDSSNSIFDRCSCFFSPTLGVVNGFTARVCLKTDSIP
ncbi:hypothetical protein HZS_2676, partial [Henneguya salminicola]